MAINAQTSAQQQSQKKGYTERVREMENRLAFVCFATIVVFFVASSSVHAQNGWDNGRATFYGDDSGSGTGGACGYDDVNAHGYGLTTTALSNVLWNGGLTCGACYQVRCHDNPKYCTSNTITVTATNQCPPSGWCSEPNKHFDLSLPMFRQIVNNIEVGIVPIQFQRVSCVKQGGIKFELKGNNDWLLVLVYNVAGAGDVKAMSVKGSKGSWIAMTRNWGQNWQASANLRGQSLSFQVTTSDGRTVQSDDVAPPNWEFGRTYEGGQF